MKKFLNSNKGITIISLVLTIIILLILSTITITMIAGENGIYSNLNEAVEETQKAMVLEKIQLAMFGVYTRSQNLDGYSLVEELEKYNAEELNYEISTNKVYGILDDRKFEVNIETNEIKLVEEFEETYFLPEGFIVSENENEDQVSGGLVAIDESGNEWVWIAVPKNIYTLATSKTDYENIEKDINEYTKEYKTPSREGASYQDEYDSRANILTSKDDYDNFKNTVLSSIYEKNGFWVSRYEIGKEDNKLVSKLGATVEIWITPENAQKGAESLNENGTLMFGFQWDLMLKFMEREIDKSVLNQDSSSIGWYLTTIKKSGTIIGDNKNKTLNIYDVGGNAWEWTLETSTDITRPYVMRGGSYYNDGSLNPASYRNNFDKDNVNIGYRVSIY